MLLVGAYLFGGTLVALGGPLLFFTVQGERHRAAVQR